MDGVTVTVLYAYAEFVSGSLATVVVLDITAQPVSVYIHCFTWCYASETETHTH